MVTIEMKILYAFITFFSIISCNYNKLKGENNNEIMNEIKTTEDTIITENYTETKTGDNNENTEYSWDELTGRNIWFDGISAIPDVRRIDLQQYGIESADTIVWIEFYDCFLSSLNNIEYMPNIYHIRFFFRNNADLMDIKSLSKLKSLKRIYIDYSDGLFRFEDLGILNKLEKVHMNGITADFKGIENLSLLKDLHTFYCDSINIEYLSGLKSIKSLSFAINESNPDIDFFRNMTGLDLDYLNIGGVVSAGKGNYYSNRFQRKEPQQRLDVSPIGSLNSINTLVLDGFILDNLSALDTLQIDNFVVYNCDIGNDIETSRRLPLFDPPYDGH
jgi:hypothetical protein